MDVFRSGCSVLEMKSLNATNLVGGQEEDQREDQGVSWEELVVAPMEGVQSLVVLAMVEVPAGPQPQQEGACAEGLSLGTDCPLVGPCPQSQRGLTRLCTLPPPLLPPHQELTDLKIKHPTVSNRLEHKVQ